MSTVLSSEEGQAGRSLVGKEAVAVVDENSVRRLEAGKEVDVREEEVEIAVTIDISERGLAGLLAIREEWDPPEGALENAGTDVEPELVRLFVG